MSRSRLPDGSLPVLRPFSQIGGTMAASIAARLLQNNWGGKGILLGGMPGVPPAEVVILGAAWWERMPPQSFLGLGAHVTVIDNDLGALQQILEPLPQCRHDDLHTHAISRRVAAYADVVVGAVLIPVERTPILDHARDGASDEAAFSSSWM